MSKVSITRADVADVNSEVLQKGAEFLLDYDDVYFRGETSTAYLVQSLLRYILDHSESDDACAESH